MENLIPLLSGFVGALIGAGTSIATMHLQTKAQNKREQVKLAAELAIEDYKIAIEMAKNRGGSYSIIPMTCYVHYHTKLLSLLDAGELTASKVRELTESNKTVIRAIKKANEEYNI